MPSNPCFRLVLVPVKFLSTHKFLLTHKSNIDEIVHTPVSLEVPLDFEASKLSPFFLLQSVTLTPWSSQYSF